MENNSHYIHPFFIDNEPWGSDDDAAVSFSAKLRKNFSAEAAAATHQPQTRVPTVRTSIPAFMQEVAVTA